MNFEVADVTRPLVAVRRIAERRNEVQFGENGGWIMNVGSCRKIPLVKKGGCYVMSVELLAIPASARGSRVSLGRRRRPDGGR